MGDQTVIQLEEGWNNEIKAKALDRLEVSVMEFGSRGSMIWAQVGSGLSAK